MKTKHLIPKGWTIVEDVEPSQFDIKDLEFLTPLKNGEFSITSNEVRKRAIEMKGNLGLDDAAYFLKHQKDIPEELKDKHISSFPVLFCAFRAAACLSPASTGMAAGGICILTGSAAAGTAMSVLDYSK